MDTATEKTIPEFVKENGITLESVELAERPDRVGSDDDWNDTAYHFKVTIKHGNATHELFYSMGCGHSTYKARKGRSIYAQRNGHGFGVRQWEIDQYKKSSHKNASIWIVKNTKPKAPDVASVVDSLRCDSDVLNYSTFEDWADCFGYETDSRKAEKTYQACIQSAVQVRALFGPSLFEELLNCEGY